MNRPITAKTALLKISMLFLIPFFLFMFGLNVYSNTIYRQRLTENNQTRLTMFESFLEEDLKNVETGLSADEIITEFMMVDMDIAEKIQKKMEKIQENFTVVK